jgi:hypothetical protein
VEYLFIIIFTLLIKLRKTMKSMRGAVLLGLGIGIPLFILPAIYFAMSKPEKKTICECVNWGKKYNNIKERELIQNGTSEEMKKFEDGKEEWSNACYDLLNPTEMSGIKKLQEDLQKCK